MLTAVIRAPGQPQALAATFAVLIPAVADGFFGHAVVVDPVGSPQIERLADATGASYLRAASGEGWNLGAQQARGDNLLLLDAGDVPQPNWVQVLERHLLLHPLTPAILPATGVAAALRERAGISFGGRRLRAGLLAPKAMVLAGRLGRAPVLLPVRRERAV
ncbi:glycosyltransferase family 2 protein [Bosea sp. (in: a-proteobacteria)]|uniref:glycosyltransferase family 2 protein n=1 Tax=Bosea sp. (in: a-proteobacteria) TaxID=1871050 RepID=UPI003B3AF04C